MKDVPNTSSNFINPRLTYQTSTMSDNQEIHTSPSRAKNDNCKFVEDMRSLREELEEVRLLSEAKGKKINLYNISQRLPGCDEQTIMKHMSPSQFYLNRHEINSLKERVDRLLPIPPTNNNINTKSTSVTLDIYRDGKQEGEITVKRTLSVEKLKKELKRKIKIETILSITKNNGVVIFDHSRHDWIKRLRDYGIKDGDRIICA